MLTLFFGMQHYLWEVYEPTLRTFEVPDFWLKRINVRESGYGHEIRALENGIIINLVDTDSLH